MNNELETLVRLKYKTITINDWNNNLWNTVYANYPRQVCNELWNFWCEYTRTQEFTLISNSYNLNELNEFLMLSLCKYEFQEKEKD